MYLELIFAAREFWIRGAVSAAKPKTVCEVHEYSVFGHVISDDASLDWQDIRVIA